MNTLHLKVTSKFIKNQNIDYSQNIIDKFIESCLKLDASIFEPYMNEDDVFEDKEKYIFLSQMHSMFSEFARDTLDDFKVEVINTVCKGCVKGEPAKHFKVTNNATKKPLDEFAFMIEVEKGILKDIYRCYEYDGCRMYTLGGALSHKNIQVSYDLMMKSRKEYLASKK